MGWKLVRDGNVKAQLSPELILSHSFCFLSRPCGDMSRSLSEVDSSLLQQQHPQVFAPPFLSHGAAPQAVLFFPKQDPVAQTQCRRGAGSSPGERPPAPLRLLWLGRCLVLVKALKSAELGWIRKTLPSLSQDMLQPVLPCFASRSR